MTKLTRTGAEGFSLQLLHDLEISGGIEWMFDGAWRVWIGSRKKDEATVSGEREAMDWLKAKAFEIYDATL